MKNKFINYIAMSVTVFLLSSCFASHTAITKRNLEVKIRMSESIFLDPLPNDKQIAYIKIRNTSGDKTLDLDSAIKDAMRAKGITITDNPDEAYYLLQANVLSSGVDNKNTVETSFGDAIIPGVIGGVIGKSTNGNLGAAIGAAAGAGAGFLGSAFVKDVTYSIVTDIRLSQKRPTYKNNEDKFKKYTTRVVSYANKVNLDYKDAQPQLLEALVESISGML